MKVIKFIFIILIIPEMSTVSMVILKVNFFRFSSISWITVDKDFTSLVRVLTVVVWDLIDSC